MGLSEGEEILIKNNMERDVNTARGLMETLITLVRTIA